MASTTHPGAITWFKYKIARRAKRAALNKKLAGTAKQMTATLRAAHRHAKLADTIARQNAHEAILEEHRKRKGRVNA